MQKKKQKKSRCKLNLLKSSLINAVPPTFSTPKQSWTNFFNLAKWSIICKYIYHSCIFFNWSSNLNISIVLFSANLFSGFSFIQHQLIKWMQKKKAEWLCTFDRAFLCSVLWFSIVFPSVNWPENFDCWDNCIQYF